MTVIRYLQKKKERLFLDNMPMNVQLIFFKIIMYNHENNIK